MTALLSLALQALRAAYALRYPLAAVDLPPAERMRADTAMLNAVVRERSYRQVVTR